MKRQLFASMLVASGLWAGQAGATLITSNAGFTSPSVIDFSQFAAACGSFGAAGCQGPLNVGALVGETVTFTGTPGFNGAAVYNGGFGLIGNGSWNSGRNGYVGDNSETSFMTFTFAAGPVSDVGAFVNYAPGAGVARMEVLDALSFVLETHDVGVEAAISTPGGLNAGAFRGISHATSDIYAIRWSGAFSVLDDLSFSRNVPEPGSLALLGLGLFGLAFRRKRKA